MLLAILAVGVAFALLSRPYPAVYRYAGGVALAGHLLFSVVVLPALPYEWDIALFHANALRVVAGSPTDPFSSVDAFATFQALAYVIFDADTTVVSVLNGLFAVLTPLPAAAIARRLYPDIDRTDGLVLALLFFPLPFLFASLPMRDALSTLLATVLLALVVRALDERDYWTAVTAVPLWAAVFLLREELALLAVIAAVAGGSALAASRLTDGEVGLRALVPAAVPSGVVGLALFAAVLPVDALNRRLQYRATGGAAYLEGMAYDSWLDVLLAAPIRAVYFQFAPFPLHVGSAFDALAIASLPALVVVSVAAVGSLRETEAREVVAVAVGAFYLAGVVGYGLVDANFGTTVRHRSVFVFLLCVFAAPALEGWYRSLSRSVSRSPSRSLAARTEAAGRRPPEDGEHEQEAQELDSRTEVRGEH